MLKSCQIVCCVRDHDACPHVMRYKYTAINLTHNVALILSWCSRSTVFVLQLKFTILKKNMLNINVMLLSKHCEHVCIDLSRTGHIYRQLSDAEYSNAYPFCIKQSTDTMLPNICLIAIILL